MKNKILKLSLIVAGSIGFAYLGNVLYKKRKERAAVNANNSICDISEQAPAETITQTHLNAPIPLKTPVEGISEAHNTDYGKCSQVKALEDDEQVDPEFLNDIKGEELTRAQEQASPIPYFISSEDYAYGHPEFDKLTLTYYAEDDILADEREEQVDDVERLIGADALDQFGKGAALLSDDTDTLYVRNETLSTDYEVVRVYQSYHKVVLGE